MIDFLQSFGIAVIAFGLVLGFVVTFHELGHFLTAKGFGVAIDRFAIGFGRAIFSRTDKAGVEWRIGWIPLGGYVRFAGDENDASVPDQNDLEEMRTRIRLQEGVGAEMKYLPFKPLWQRALVVLAGPVANFVLAIIIFTFMFSVIGERVTPAVISTVVPGTAAARAGFLPGDRIISADGRPLSTQMDLTEYVQPRDGRPIDFGVIRANGQIHITATPTLTSVQNDFNLEQHAGQLGVFITGGHWQRYSLPEAVGKATQRTWSVVSTTVFYIGRMVSGQVSGDQIGGPLRIATVAGAVASTSLHQHVPLAEALADTALNLLNLAAFVSVSLGFANLLPIPVLDGGHLLFYAYEAVARRPLGARLQAAGYRLGLALLLCLMLFATWNDLHLFRVFRSLGGLFS